jgi:octanoyl-[GcvH]:protein N-octanoyltransferase
VSVLLLRDGHPDDPVLDLAVTEALLRRVGAGELGPVARAYRPGATLAFGRMDARLPGFADAAAAARAHGFVPAVRLGGGRAAAYDAGAVVVDVITPVATIAGGVEARFADAAALQLEALARVGVEAQVGELPREYCPGRWSVHAGGVKLAGTAQRTIRGAALTTAVLLAEGGDRLRAVLVDVYAALGLDWDPATAGAAQDLVPAVTAGALHEAALDVLRARGGRDGALDGTTRELAATLRPPPDRDG